DLSAFWRIYLRSGGFICVLEDLSVFRRIYLRSNAFTPAATKKDPLKISGSCTSLLNSQILYNRRNAHAAGDAQRDDAVLLAGALEFMHELRQQDGAGRADRVAHCNGAAVRVDPAAVGAEFVDAGDGL